MDVTSSIVNVDVSGSQLSVIMQTGGNTTIVSNNTSVMASEIGTTSVGELSAANLQDALQELDADINSIGDLSTLFDNKLI